MSGRTAGSRRATATASEDKAWASGRVLTPEQRARKQEADRKANRFLKKEVQDRLSLLEARVLELESRNAEIEGDIIFSTRPNAQLGDSGLIDAENTTRNADNSQQQPLLQHGAESFIPEASHQTGNQATPMEYATTSATPMTASAIEPSQASVAPDFTDVVTTARTRPDGRHLTCFLNNLVNYIRTLAPAAVCFDDTLNQDLVVSAVLKGWEHTLCRYHRKCPLWDVLRLVDSYLFKDCNMVERISVLRMLHKRYLYEVNANLPTAGPPPPWFRPQFSEKIFFHDPVIDHLTWPRLRDRLIASETDRLTNKFWALFVKNLHVVWEHEPFDIMTFSGDKQLYQLTPDFETSLMDIANWRMDMDFFRGIPQLAQDVPPYNYMPLRTVSPKLGPGHQLPSQQMGISPAFGLQDLDHRRQHGQEPTSDEDTWIPQHQSFSEPNSAMELSKMTAPDGSWSDFYT